MRRGLILLVGALGLAAYANTVPNGFVYDDIPIIVENPRIRDLSSVGRLFATPYWWWDLPVQKFPDGGLYRPLTLLTFALNYRVGGLDPRGYHLANAVLHAAACVLALLLLAALGLPDRAAAAGALAFAALPAHVEAVASVVGRAEVLGAVFVFCSWLLLFRRRGALRLSLSCASFVLALLSKENAAAFPAAFVLSEYAASRSSWKELGKERLVEWTALSGTLLLYLEWRRAILGAALSDGGVHYFPYQGLLVRALTMARFFLTHYLWPMATGLGLRAEYSRPAFSDAAVSQPLPWLCLAALCAAAAAAAWALLRRRSLAGLGAAVFLILMLPVSNILFRVGVIGAERFLYLPSIGFCLLFGLALRDARPVWALPFLAWWTFLTAARNDVWRTQESFWTAAAEAAPPSPRALNGLATVYDLKGDRAGARRCLLEAIALDPRLTEATYNLGKSYYEEGDLPRAEEWFLKTLRTAGPDKDSLCHLGLIAERRGDAGKALLWYRRALELEPVNSTIRRDLGLLLYRLGRKVEAARELELAVRLAPRGDNNDDLAALLGSLRQAASGAGVLKNGLKRG